MIQDGERKATLVSLAGTLHNRRMSIKSIRAALEADNQARCVPPLEEKEIDDILKSVTKWREQLTPNSNDSKDEGVSCYPEELEEELTPETKLVAFPEDAWRGPFVAWRDIVSPCTESPADLYGRHVS